MLPFLKNVKSQATGIAMEVRKADDSDKPEDSDAGLRSAAMDLIQAIQANDEKGVMSALRAAFQILDSEPHVEGPHENPEG